MDFFIDFVTKNFANCIWLVVLLIAICPTLESKISIPLAMNTAFWGNNAYSPVIALLLSFLGSMLPCFFIMLLTRKIKNKTSGFLTSRFIEKYRAKCSKINTEKSNLKKYLLLACFVAIPIPLTGVWTGSLVAGFTNLKLKNCFIAISIGAFISACAVTILCCLFKNSMTYILMISILIIIAFLFIELFISIFNSNRKRI